MSDKEKMKSPTEAETGNSENREINEETVPVAQVVTDSLKEGEEGFPNLHKNETGDEEASAPSQSGDASQNQTEPETGGEPLASNADASPNIKSEVAEPEFDDDRDVLAPSRCARIFNALAHVGPLVLIIAICLMVWPDFWEAFRGSGFYCPAEVTPITAAMRSIDQNVWLTPAALGANGWIAQWPAYTWLLGLLNLLTDIPGFPPDVIFPLAASLCACVCVLAVWGLAHAARFGSQASLASGLILLCAPLFAPLPHFVGSSVLSATLMILSLAFFCRGWIRQRAWVSLPIAFILCGLAGLSGGIFYLGIPLVASICFLVWRGSFRRGQAKDALFGFALLLILLGCWVSSVILLGSEGNYLADLFHSGLRFEWPPQAMWWLVFVIAAAGALPWLFTIFGVSWVRVLTQSLSSFSASRHENGSALIWISLVIGCLVAPFFSHKPGIAIALLCLAAPLLGKAFIRMPPFGNKFFFFLASLFTILAGLVILGASFTFSQNWIFGLCPNLPSWLAPALLNLTALPIMGGIVLLAGIIAIIVFTRRDHQGGGLVFSLVVAIILCQPAVLMLAPELAATQQASLLSIADIHGIYQKNTANEAIPPAAPVAPEPSDAPIIVPSTPATPDNEQKTQDESNVKQPEEAPLPPAIALPPATPAEPDAATQQPPASESAAPSPGAEVPEVSPTPDNGGANGEQQPDQPAEAAPAPEAPANQDQASEASPEQKPEEVIEEVIVETPAPEKEGQEPRGEATGQN